MALLNTQKVELLDKIEFLATDPDTNAKRFVIYITFFLAISI